MAWFAHDNDTPLSKNQYLVLVIVSHVSAALSLFGSSCIIYKAVKSKQLRRSTYHRLLFCLSTADILLSSAFFAHPVSSSNRFSCARFALKTTSNILFLILFSSRSIIDPSGCFLVALGILGLLDLDRLALPLDLYSDSRVSLSSSTIAS